VAYETNLSDTIEENAQGPAEAAGDSSRVRQHSLKDQIEADKYLRSKEAQASKSKGLVFRRLIPPGTTGC